MENLKKYHLIAKENSNNDIVIYWEKIQILSIKEKYKKWVSDFLLKTQLNTNLSKFLYKFGFIFISKLIINNYDLLVYESKNHILYFSKSSNLNIIFTNTIYEFKGINNTLVITEK